MRSPRVVVFLATLLCVVPVVSIAQNSASANITADVQQPITVTKTNDLTFAGTDFIPSASATSAVLNGSGGLYVFVGATVSPSVSQAVGQYTGTATMTVVYF